MNRTENDSSDLRDVVKNWTERTRFGCGEIVFICVKNTKNEVLRELPIATAGCCGIVPSGGQKLLPRSTQEILTNVFGTKFPKTNSLVILVQ